MDRGAWRATIHEVVKVRLDWASTAAAQTPGYAHILAPGLDFPAPPAVPLPAPSPVSRVKSGIKKAEQLGTQILPRASL